MKQLKLGKDIYWAEASSLPFSHWGSVLPSILEIHFSLLTQKPWPHHSRAIAAVISTRDANIPNHSKACIENALRHFQHILYLNVNQLEGTPILLLPNKLKSLYIRGKSIGAFHYGTYTQRKWLQVVQVHPMYTGICWNVPLPGHCTSTVKTGLPFHSLNWSFGADTVTTYFSA